MTANIAMSMFLLNWWKRSSSFYFGSNNRTEKPKLGETMKNFIRTLAVIVVAVVCVHFFGWMVGIALVGGYMWGTSK